MLGNILGGLTNAAAAEELLATIADEGLLMRVKIAADENSVTTGAYVAANVRQLLDYGSEEIWLDLVSKMANSPQPGAAALQAILARAFPEATASACCGHDSKGHGHHIQAQAVLVEGLKSP